VTSQYPNFMEIRRWAQAKGLPVSGVGKLPYGLIKAWDRAHPDRPFVKAEAHHGSATGYTQYGCRCEPCTAVAVAAESARWKLNREDREWA
jgi:hypothetical protein